MTPRRSAEPGGCSPPAWTNTCATAGRWKPLWPPRCRTGGFTLHYQPLLNLAGNRITGFEALLRWRQPDGTLVPPAGFIPVAAQSGLIVAIGAWVLRTACAEAAGWPMRKAAPRRRDTSSARRGRRRRSPAC
ncbi:EAL domain-containing protein [Rhodopila globiformis]